MTLRTLYRFIDEGQLPAYKMGRVIRLQASDVDDFISRARIVPGTLEHLYPDPRGAQSGRGQHHDDEAMPEPSRPAAKRASDVMDLDDAQGENGQ